MKTLLLGIALIVVLGLGGVFLGMGKGSTYTPLVMPQTTQYTSPTAKVSFAYPNSYELQEHPDSFENNPVSVMTLIKKGTVVPDMSEGPVMISVLAVGNASGTPLETWVKEKSISNYYLSQTKTLSQTLVGGEAALAYSYSGLYENDAVAVAHNGKVYLFFVSWMDASDPMRADFQNLLKTVQFQ